MQPSEIWVALAVSGGNSSNGPTVTTALVGLIGLLLGSLIAGGFRLAGDKQARRADSQRAALYELQEGAFRLRTTLRSYGREMPHPSEEATDALDDANGRLDLLIERVICALVQERARAWRTAAEQYWTGDNTLTIGMEDAEWRSLHKTVGQEIRRFDD